MKIKVVFFSSDQYGAKALEVLKKSPDLEIIRIIKNKNELESLKKADFQPDIGIVASFGALIPSDIINWPKKGLLNLHPSLLPKYRGPTPVPSAILNGEKETGLTIIKVDEEIDHGPIVSQFKEGIKVNDTSESLLNRLFTLGGQVLTTILPSYLEGKIELRQQNHSQATYTQKLTRDDGKIDWTKPVEYLERFIRAMFPWPGAWDEVEINSQVKRLKILKAYLENKKLILDQVQLEGKKPVTWKQFLEGYPQVKLPF
ncbi:methionyl-tRNA formyltransferase [Patescibacteria group bacterium]|nr:methionyl-tRNA formyltransferase [Patescibacteria group bacterium]